METGQGVVSLIVNGGPADLMFFQSAFRMPHRKIVVIGDSSEIREAVANGIAKAPVEFMPTGTVPLPESIILDATKFKTAGA